MKNTAQEHKTSQKKSLKKLFEEFSQTTGLEKAIKIVHDGSLQHRCYQHYTTVDALLAMIEGQSMRLTRGNSLSLDDNRECQKYGDDDSWNHTYIGCFSYGGAESAAMWGLYCKGDPEAIRIKISQKDMKDWIGSLEKNIDENGSVAFSDIIYTSVKGRDEKRERSNVLYWDGEHSMKIEKLSDKVSKCPGMLKDYEWRFEDESRLIVTLKGRNVERMFVPLTRKILKNMWITFSPWSTEADRTRMKTQINAALDAALGADAVHIDGRCNGSALEGALRKWGRQGEAGREKQGQ